MRKFTRNILTAAEYAAASITVFGTKQVRPTHHTMPRECNKFFFIFKLDSVFRKFVNVNQTLNPSAGKRNYNEFSSQHAEIHIKWRDPFVEYTHSNYIACIDPL